jgi:hypothetical protein
VGGLFAVQYKDTRRERQPIASYLAISASILVYAGMRRSEYLDF